MAKILGIILLGSLIIFLIGAMGITIYFLYKLLKELLKD